MRVNVVPLTPCILDLQVSDAAKAQVSAQAKERARLLAKEALEKRLADIDMDVHDYALYEKIFGRVEQQV